jgi:hypothetical protein
MAVPLTDKRIFQTERLRAFGKTMSGEIDKLGDVAGLSGKARRLIVHKHDQLGDGLHFVLTRCAQNRLLPRSKLGKHKNPKRVSDKAYATSAVTPDGTAEEAGFSSDAMCRQTSMVMGSSMKPLNADNS